MNSGEPRKELNASTVIARAIRDARRFDRSRVSLKVGLIAAIPVAGMLALGTLIGRPVIAVTLGAGAMLGGVAWRAAGPDDPPVGTMAAAVAGLGLATFAGSVSGRHAWLHLALLIVLALCAGVLVSLGRRGSVPGTQAMIAYVVFGRFPQPLDSALGLAGLVMAGAGSQAAFALLVALPPAWRQQRQALAEAYRRLAALAANPRTSSVPAAAALDAAETKLLAPTLLGDPALMTLSSLVAEGRRIRLELIVIGTVASEQVSLGAAPVLTAIADAIADPTEGADQALAGAAEARDGEPAGRGGRHAAALASQLQAAARMAAQAGRDRPWTLTRPRRGSNRAADRARSDLEQLRANISLKTAAGRHAARLAIVVALAELLAQHTPLPRGYWAVVAAATVLRPEFGATFTRGAERMAGSVLGVVIATFIVVGLNPSGWGIVLVVGLLATATYAVFPASFAAGTALLTAVIVFLLHAVAPDSATIALDRGLDTVIGGALGLAAYAVWPTWSGGSTRRVMAELVDAQREYVLAVLGQIIDGTGPDDDTLRPLARAARIAWSNADAVVTIAQKEPAERLGDSGLRAIAALSGLRRLVYAGHTLRLEASTATARAPHPAWAAFRDGLDRELGAIASVLRERPAASVATLRALFGAAREADPLDQALLLPLDEILDATNTVAATVGLDPPPA
jgi:uncharacterized membrane protein YgaE (UPF0421/DUF939 family)